MFFDKLQALCDEKGIAMSALLDQVGMSRGNMARWKDGLTPKPATQIKLAEALGVDRELLQEKPESEDRKQEDPAAKSCEVSDDDIKFALFGGAKVTDAQYEEVKRFAKYIADRGIHSD